MPNNGNRRYATPRSDSRPRLKMPSGLRTPRTERGARDGGIGGRSGRSSYLGRTSNLKFGSSRPQVPILPIAIAAAIVLIAAILLLRVDVTVNSVPIRTWRWSTVQSLIDKGYASPVPGDLLAVDGSVLEEGGGDICAARIDGQAAEPSARVKRGADITIGDGADVTEEFTSTEQAIPAGRSDAEMSAASYYYGSIHLLSDGQDGVLTTRTGKTSGKSVTEVTTPAIDAGYQIYSVSTEDKVIALTFDDGPWPETTEAILDVLEENGAKATFFTIGNQIADRPELLRRAHEMGCQVLTHTWDHADGSGQGVNITYMSAEEQVSEIQQGYAAIKDAIGEEPAHILRAPGGNFYGDAVTNLWPYVDAEIGWDVDTEDWALPGTDHIVSMILSAKPGQVVLMHDGGGNRTQTVEALRQALPQLVEQGYSFVTIDELLAYGPPESQAEAQGETQA